MGSSRRIPARAACVAAAAALLAGCCGADERAPEPRLPAALASDLAARSDRVAAALARGDACAAHARARELQAATQKALSEGAVPPPFRRPLRSRVDDLVSRIECAPAPPPAAADEREDELEEEEDDLDNERGGTDEDAGEGEGNGKGKGQGRGKAKAKGKRG